MRKSIHIFPRQNSDRVETDEGRDTIRSPGKTPVRPFPLHLGRRPVQRWKLRPVRLVGQDPAPVGLGRGQDDEAFRGPHKGLIDIYIFKA